MSELEDVIKKMEFLACKYLDSYVFPTKEGVELTVKNGSNEEVLNPRTNRKESKFVIYFDELKWGLIVGSKKNKKKLLGLKEKNNGLKGVKLKLFNDLGVKHQFGTGAIRFK
jgi:hypothetical protein